MRFACWITKTIDTNSEYKILIAFSQKKWLHEPASMLGLYVHFLSCYRSVDNTKVMGKRRKRTSFQSQSLGVNGKEILKFNLIKKVIAVIIPTYAQITSLLHILGYMFRPFWVIIRAL
jgi:hypothetical protein